MRYYKENRNILVYFFLSLLTLGIYGIWTLHCLVQDANEFCKEDGKKSSGVLILILFSLLTCGLYGIFWHYRIADMLEQHAKKKKIETKLSASMVLIAQLIGVLLFTPIVLVGLHMIFQATNAIAEYHNDEARRMRYYQSHN